MLFRPFVIGLSLSAAVFAAGVASGVPDAARSLEDRLAKAPGPVANELRSIAAKALQERYPELAKKFTTTTAAPSERAPRTTPPPEAAAIQKRMGQMRGLATDEDRARLAIELSKEIRALPAGSAKLILAQGICNLSTEGDLGKEALAAVSGTLAQAMRETPGSASSYLELASLVRYEHVPPPPADPALDAADVLLVLRQALAQENDFTLTSLDGKSYTLSALRGKVVLLNF